MDDFQVKYLLNIKAGELSDFRYGLLVQNYMFNQKRIQITDIRMRDPLMPDGHGAIVQEL